MTQRGPDPLHEATEYVRLSLDTMLDPVTLAAMTDDEWSDDGSLLVDDVEVVLGYLFTREGLPFYEAEYAALMMDPYWW